MKRGAVLIPIPGGITRAARQCARCGQRDVVSHRKQKDEPWCLAIFGQQGRCIVDRFSRVRIADRVADHLDEPESKFCRIPKIARADLRSARANQPRQPDDLPLPHIERDTAVTAIAIQPVDLQRNLPEWNRLLGNCLGQLRPTINQDQIVGVWVGHGRVSTYFASSRNTVGDAMRPHGWRRSRSCQWEIRMIPVPRAFNF